jgi:hypothetical protein
LAKLLRHHSWRWRVSAVSKDWFGAVLLQLSNLANHFGIASLVLIIRKKIDSELTSEKPSTRPSGITPAGTATLASGIGKLWI